MWPNRVPTVISDVEVDPRQAEAISADGSTIAGIAYQPEVGFVVFAEVDGVVSSLGTGNAWGISADGAVITGSQNNDPVIWINAGI